jgi:hypothetical protein
MIRPTVKITKERDHRKENLCTVSWGKGSTAEQPDNRTQIIPKPTSTWMNYVASVENSWSAVLKLEEVVSEMQIMNR